MDSRGTPPARTFLRWLTLCLGSASLALLVYAFVGSSGMAETLEGRLLPKQLQSPQKWVTLTDQHMESGATLPANTNVIIHIPEYVHRITRHTLFGRTGLRIRYWGYCFPQDYDRDAVLRRKKFPGSLFLSEKEREVREIADKAHRKATFSVTKNLNEADLNAVRAVSGGIRHEQEVFTGGQSCYLMAEEPLPIGIDPDNDLANNRVEAIAGTDPTIADTDGDGLSDGLEIFWMHSNPLFRDTDADNLLDGIEDANLNGRVDDDETSPILWDTDRDGLCDGLCRVRLNKGEALRGEDKNLNGVVDTGETDPRKFDTDGNGINDSQEYFNCLLDGKTNC